ncbi:MAG: RDD family protein, partial [Muribaculaceae bacterium]|nr:RDD family protein [Muribaculaceae bacterium]
QRLGDLAAGTMVAKTKTPYIALPDYSYTMEGYVPTYSEASELSMNQAELINRVLNYMRPDRAELVNRLALKIQKTYGVVPQGGTQEQFLYTMLNDYGYYCSTIEA